MMRTLWAHGPGTVSEVQRRLARRLAYTSVLTMLRILEQKGYARREMDLDHGRAHRYAAAVREQDVQSGHVRDLVDRFFDGRPEELVLGLLDNDKLSRSDLQRMRRALDEKLRARGKRQ